MKKPIRTTSFQGVKRLFVLAYFISAGNDADQEAGIKDNIKSFLQRAEIKITMY